MSSELIIDTPIGPLRLEGDNEGLQRIVFLDGEKKSPRDSSRSPPVLKAAREQLIAYFDGQLKAFDLPLSPRGTEFQQAVWQALAEIPWGETRSYREIAEVIDRPKAVRAVGAANGANPLPIVLPCHRVIGADGSLTGYAGGLDRKKALLTLEGYDQEQSGLFE